ncbi:MAG TPA: hypothetical protein VFM33_04000 [Aquabacterium sp.]|nr:hypothetical protein [Aquabacterium sp.]
MQFQRPTKTGNRFVQLPELAQHDTSIAVDLNHVGLGFKRQVVVIERLIKLAEILEHIPQITLGTGISRINCYGLAHQ